jgi:alpha-beta hydrolase superfamily lysophospholipase
MKRLTFPEHDIEGTRHTLAYGQYRLSYEVYGSGDRVLVWMHGLLLDANLSRGLARSLAAKGNRVVLLDLLGHGIDLIHSFADAKRLARQLPDARLIRTRTFAELWVHPARLTSEISEFLDRVWADDEPRNQAEVS